jgi:hypothetical protein
VNQIVLPFSLDSLKQFFKQSIKVRYIFDYLSELGAKTCIIEDRYIDKDYMVDYQKFYSRSFEKLPRETTRIHFFNEYLCEDDLMVALNGKYEQLTQSYLGFVVIKPIYRDSNKEIPLLGRTILKTYPKEDGNKKRFFVTEKYHASLFGVPLDVVSLPFQDQDLGVGMCATTALWSTMQPLINPYGIQRHSPAEITEISSLHPALSRRFPSDGLTLEQILRYIQSAGLDVEVIGATEKTIPIAVKAYINARVPIIAILALKHRGEPEEVWDWHAAVISGYKSNECRNVEELYIHDDGIGPFCRAHPVHNNFKFWDNEWISERGYDTCEVYHLFAPIYSKIRLTFPLIFKYFEEKQNVARSPELDLELLLYTIRKYKRFLLDFKIKSKPDMLKTFLPRFLWVIRTYYKNRLLRDDIFDATSVYVRYCKTIAYLE